MNQIDLLFLIASTLLMTLFSVKVFKHLAPQLGLVDKPNSRKVHQNQIPVVGGVSILCGLVLTTFLNTHLYNAIAHHLVVFGTGFILLLVGVFDDKLNLSARFRLLLQFLAALAVALAGYRITSLHGLFGIEELHPIVSYAITVVLIAGVVNAFNLIDGIDGLAGFIAVIGLSTFALLAYQLGQFNSLLILVTVVLSLLVFLKTNLSKQKIFLGDGGSLFIGFLMVCFGIEMINASQSLTTVQTNKTTISVIAVFLIPVLDSLRVYWTRINYGHSPFKADKSHIHHLFLGLNLQHKQASVAIAIMALLFIGSASLLISSFGITITLVVLMLLVLITMTLLNALKNLKEWSSKIKSLEN
jgi:UDP-GlcNAc:undecaprenyl-phosphate GlcNAc-1-phosphate transferase